MCRGIRTIQRYEENLHLPIHRPAGRTRTAVLAFSDEVDEWLAKTPTRDRLFENGEGASDVPAEL